MFFRPSISKLISALVGSVLLLIQVVFKIEEKSCVFIFSIFVFLSLLSGVPQLEKIKMPMTNNMAPATKSFICLFILIFFIKLIYISKLNVF
mgnify:CR=1 FL=1